MKKHLVKLLALSALVLTGCGGDNSSTVAPSTPAQSTPAPSTPAPSTPAPSTPAPSTPAPSTPALPTFTITPVKKTVDVEKGAEASVRVTVTCTDPTKAKTVEWTIEQEDDIIAFAEGQVTTANAGSVKITGLKVGTAKLVATATLNPANKVEIPVNVVAAIPPVANVWNNIITVGNYTLDVYRAPTSQETVVHSTWDEDTLVPVSQMKATDSVLTYKVATAVADDLTATYGSLFQNKLIGYGVDQNDHVLAISETDAGYAVTVDSQTNKPRTAVRSSAGLLNKKNFKGGGMSATSPNDVDAFGGLEATNPLWLPTTKDASNTYAIEADATDTANYQNRVLAKVSILQTVATQKFYSLLSSGVSTFVDLEAAAQITLNTVSSNNLTMDITFTDNTTYHAVLSDIGSTTVDAALTTFVTNTVADLPALAPEVQAFKDALGEHDYVVTYDYESYGEKLCYYVTKDYLFTVDYVLDGTDYVVSSGSGYAKKDGKFYEVKYVPATVDEETNTETAPADVTFTDVSSDLAAQGVTSADNLWELFSPYLELTDSFWYNLGETEETFFQGYPASYLVQNTAAAAEFANYISPRIAPTVLQAPSAVVLLTIDSTTNTDGDIILSNVTTLLGVQQSGTNWGTYYSPVFSDFGKANTANPFAQKFDTFFGLVA